MPNRDIMEWASFYISDNVSAAEQIVLENLTAHLTGTISSDVFSGSGITGLDVYDLADLHRGSTVRENYLPLDVTTTDSESDVQHQGLQVFIIQARFRYNDDANKTASLFLAAGKGVRVVEATMVGGKKYLFPAIIEEVQLVGDDVRRPPEIQVNLRNIGKHAVELVG